MCIIISKPEKRKLKTEFYANSFKHNKDGAGVAYVENNELKIKKGIFTEDEFVKFVEAREDQELLIHCRVATHGLINADNCHPFLIPATEMFPHMSFAVAHNGQLPWRSTKTQSDTSCFIEDLLAPWLQQNPWFFDQPYAEEVLGKFITDRNKLVIMRYDSKEKETTTYIVNAKEGIKAFGCWFSNDTYAFARVRYTRYTDDENYWRAQGMLPGYGAARLGLPAPKITPDKVGSVLDDFGDWVKFEGKWLNFNPNYVGANKMSDDQRTRWRKFVEDKAAQIKRDAESKSKSKSTPPTPPPPTIPATGGATTTPVVVVPRDADVKMPEDMPWLNETDRDTLRSYALLWFKRYSAYDIKGKSLRELLGDFRGDIRGLLPNFKGLADANVDMQFLADAETYLADMDTKDTELKMENDVERYMQ